MVRMRFVLNTPSQTENSVVFRNTRLVFLAVTVDTAEQLLHSLEVRVFVRVVLEFPALWELDWTESE